MRLARYVAKSGLLSRRKAEDLILAGKIEVNGKIIRELSYNISEKDKVYYNGKRLLPEQSLVIALNKPVGYISSARDDRGRKTVIDLIPGIEQRLYPVGRLDYRSRGLIILTNDGDLANKIMHPRYQVEKKYEVRLDKKLPNDIIENIRAGRVSVEKKKVQVTSMEVARTGKRILMTITEGRKRIIRRMFRKLGFEVIDLKRTEIGSLDLVGLKPGKYRILDKKEISDLLNSAQPSNG